MIPIIDDHSLVERVSTRLNLPFVGALFRLPRGIYPVENHTLRCFCICIFLIRSVRAKCEIVSCALLGGLIVDLNGILSTLTPGVLSEVLFRILHHRVAIRKYQLLDFLIIETVHNRILRRAFHVLLRHLLVLGSALAAFLVTSSRCSWSRVALRPPVVEEAGLLDGSVLGAQYSVIGSPILWC